MVLSLCLRGPGRVFYRLSSLDCENDVQPTLSRPVCKKKDDCALPWTARCSRDWC